MDMCTVSDDIMPDLKLHFGLSVLLVPIQFTFGSAARCIDCEATDTNIYIMLSGRYRGDPTPLAVCVYN